MEQRACHTYTTTCHGEQLATTRARARFVIGLPLAFRERLGGSRHRGRIERHVSLCGVHRQLQSCCTLDYAVMLYATRGGTGAVGAWMGANTPEAAFTRLERGHTHTEMLWECVIRICPC